MISDLGVLFLKLLLVVLCICIAKALEVHYGIQNKLKRLEANGVVNYPDNGTFVVGPVKKLEAEYFRQAKSKDSLPGEQIWMLSRLNYQKPGMPAIDASKNRMVAVNFFGKVITYVQDPDVVADMYNKHATAIEKHEMTGEIYEPMFKQFLPVTPNSEQQKTVRKAVSHLLFKERLNIMLGVYKTHVNASCDRWVEEIAKNGQTRIDIRTEVERIFAHTINHLCFGEDFNDDKFDIHFYDMVSDSFTEKKVSMREAIHNVTIQTLRRYVKQQKHPIAGPLGIIFGIKIEMGEFHRLMRENTERIRGKINGYIQNRKAGKHKSNLADYDLLSVFLTDQTTFPDEWIIDTLFGFVFALTRMPQYISQTILSYLASSKESVQKCRDDFEKNVLKPALEEDASLANLSKSEQMDKLIDMEKVQEFEFTSMVVQEALRYRPSVPFSHYYKTTKDLTLGKYKFEKGDILSVCFESLGHDPEQWQRPEEFLPQRFDFNDPLSLTPKGKKRHANSLVPFHGGNRSCLGKSYAEAQLKILSTYMCQKFDFEFEDKENAMHLPLSQTDQTIEPPIWLKMTARKE